MIKIEFSKDEVNALISLIDLATKGGGLQVAEAAVVLAKKIQAATQPKDSGPPVEELDE